MNDSMDSLEKAIDESSEILDQFEEWIDTQKHIPKNIRELFFFLKILIEFRGTSFVV